MSDLEPEKKPVTCTSYVDDEFHDAKSGLLEQIEEIKALSESAAIGCEELEGKLRSNTFNLVVVGQFKRGKTYLINALIGEPLLPVGVVPLTSIVTILTFGKDTSVSVRFNDDTEREIGLADLPLYVTESGNPRNEKNVREVLISYPSPYLEGGVRLIDTPGVGSIYLHNTDVAYQYLPRSDAALFLLSVDQPVSQAELDFLNDVREYSHKIFFLLNKLDYLTPEELEESVAFTEGALHEALNISVSIFPLSAKLALQGKLDGSLNLVDRSRLPEFSKRLTEFLVCEKGTVLLLSVGRGLRRILSHERLQTEIALKSLVTPVHELEEKLELFEKRSREILAEKENFALHLDGELKRFVKSVLDEDIARFRKELMAAMEEKFDSFYEENKDLALKELNDALQSFAIGSVEKAFADWKRLEEEKVSDAFERICNGYAAKIGAMVDGLLKFSSELFSVQFQVVEAQSFWTRDLDFYFKMKQEPVGLDMLADSASQIWPKYISDRFERLKAYVFRVANRFIMNKRKRQMLEIIDMQAGRIRYDFLKRLEKGRSLFQREVLKRVDAAIDAISRAIEQGKSRKLQGEQDVAKEMVALDEKLRRIHRIDAAVIHFSGEALDQRG